MNTPRRPFNRTSLNAIIDGLGFAAFLFLASTGALLYFVLPPGSGRLGAAGAGRGLGGEALAVWGWTRHEWGTIHAWLAVALISIMAWHLALHWKWIVCVVKGKVRATSRKRWAVAVVLLLAVASLAVAPLVSGVGKASRGPHVPERETMHDASNDVRRLGRPFSRTTPRMAPSPGMARTFEP